MSQIVKEFNVKLPAQPSPNLNQDELLSLKTQLEGAAERAETFKREIERLRAEKTAPAPLLESSFGVQFLFKLLEPFSTSWTLDFNFNASSP